MATDGGRYTVRLPDELAEGIEDYVEEHDITTSDAFRDLLERAIDTHPWYHHLGLSLHQASYQVFALAVLVFIGALFWPSASMMNGAIMSTAIAGMGVATMLFSLYLVEDRDDLT